MRSAGPDPWMEELLDRIGAASVARVSTGVECCQAAREASCIAIIANFPLPDCTPEELLGEIKRLDPAAVVLIRDSTGSLSGAIRLKGAGADHVLGFDFDIEEVTRLIGGARELRYHRELMALSSAVDQPAESVPAGRKFW